MRSLQRFTTNIETKLFANLQSTTLSESEVLTEKKEKYKRKNKLFGVWLPIDVHKWFVNYLKVKSII